MRLGRELGLELVDALLHRRDPLLPDVGDVGIGPGATGRREHRANGEELILEVLAPRIQDTEAGRPGDAERRVQLVDITVRRHPGVVLRHPAASEEARLPAVAGARVDLHRAQAGTLGPSGRPTEVGARAAVCYEGRRRGPPRT